MGNYEERFYLRAASSAIGKLCRCDTNWLQFPFTQKRPGNFVEKLIAIDIACRHIYIYIQHMNIQS